MLVLVMARLLAAIMVAPIFGHRSVPAVSKIILAAFVAWLLVVPGGMPASPASDFAGFLLALGAEILLGLLLGFTSSLVFWALAMAGDLVASQIGWGFAGGFHQSVESSSVALGQFYTVLGSLIYLGIGGHRLLLVALANTFAAAPPRAFVVGGLQVERLIETTGALFTGAFQVALPAIGTLLLTDAVLALLSRVLPQLNAFIFGLPLKIAAGLLAIWISLPLALLFVARWLSKGILNVQFLVK
jgi:flagellar biosynthetic protein FliR